MTIAEVILAAAYALHRRFGGEFEEADLTLAAWDADRPRLGLRGYTNSYPDHKRVYAEVVGNLIGRKRWLVRSRPLHFRLTDAGLAKARELSFSALAAKREAS